MDHLSHYLAQNDHHLIVCVDEDELGLPFMTINLSQLSWPSGLHVKSHPPDGAAAVYFPKTRT